MLMHVVAAVVIVSMLTTLTRTQRTCAPVVLPTKNICPVRTPLLRYTTPCLPAGAGSAFEHGNNGSQPRNGGIRKPVCPECRFEPGSFD